MKNYRTTKFYKNLTPYMATAIAEGFCEGENATEQEQLTAWQYLRDTRLAYQLQGFFSRRCNRLIEDGLIRK